MKNKQYVRVLAGLGSLLMSGMVSAIPFDFTPGNLGVPNMNGAYNSVSMTNGGITVDVTAYTIINDGIGNITSLTQVTGAGVGVRVRAGSNPNLGVRSLPGDGSMLDGGTGNSSTDPDEGLLFIFSEIVNFDYINFDSFDSSDDFNLTVDGTLVLIDFDENSISPFANSTSEQDKFNFTNVTGKEFLFWADGNSDNFRIDDLRVSVVPGPASLLLLGAGLVGLSFARRKMAA